MKDTKIEWARHTFNAWHGCEKLSPACKNCYAETFTKRIGLDIWGAEKPRRFFGDAHWRQPLLWNRRAELAGERHRVFCNSMGDIFEDRPDLVEPRARLFMLIERTPHLDWLLLTKRPENLALRPHREMPANVWLGATIETQEYTRRAYDLVDQVYGPAVRFVSYEPALGPIDWAPLLTFGIDWVIVGGESGNQPRELDIDWVRRTADACQEAGVPIFVKQDSGRFPGQQGRIPDDLWALKQVPEVAPCG